MKISISIFTAVLITAFFSSSAFAQKAKSDYDKNTDFTKYKSYAFAGWQQDSDKQLNDFDKKRILESLKSEFDARGMNLVESGADAWVSIFIVIDQKTSTTAYTNYNGGMGYGMGRGWGMGYGGMGMGSSTTTYSENDYLEGTFVVDIYDESSKDLVWQGVITGTVNEKPKKREKGIPKSMAKLMKKYPVAPVK
jgi:hypothetical protein